MGPCAHAMSAQVDEEQYSAVVDGEEEVVIEALEGERLDLEVA